MRRLFASRRGRFAAAAGLLVLLLAGGAAFVVWRASAELVHPARRKLQAYHHDWLESPAAHGISIQRWEAMNGRVPCLLVLPDRAGGLSPRGAAIRKQLEEAGTKLPAFGETRANLVLLHGRNGRKEDLLPVAERFCAAGFRCLLPDLPAHGESPLKVASFGASEFDAGLPAGVLEEAIGRFKLPRDPAGLWGMSMGGAYLARAASAPGAPWRALVVVCSFDTLNAVLRRKVSFYAGPAAPLFVSAISMSCVARGGVDPAAVTPADWAAKVSTPLLVAHGTDDDLILLDSGRKLFEAYASPEKQWLVVKGGTHNNVLVTEMPLYSAMAGWFAAHLE